MKNFLLLGLMLICFTSSASAQQWRKAMRENDAVWVKQKVRYENAMANYYLASYEFDLQDQKFKALESKVKELEAITTKEKPAGLLPATDAAWELKLKKQNQDLATAKSELEKLRPTRDELQNTVDAFKPNLEVLKSDLNAAAKTANFNATNNDRSDIKRGQKILNETSGDVASDSTLNELNLNADKRAAEAFRNKYPDEDLPGSKRELVMKKVNATTEQPKTEPTEQAKIDPALLNKIATGLGFSSMEKVKAEEKKPEAESIKKESPIETPVVAQKPDPATVCDQAKTEIVKLLLSNGQNPKAFSDMVNLAQLKMAYRLAQPKPPSHTIEDYLKTKKMQSIVRKSYETDEKLKTSVTTLYQKYGKMTDINESNLMGNKELKYSKVRLTNDSASALILYLSQNEKDKSKLAFTEQDAAAVWAQQNLIDVHQFQPGDANYNLLNFSTQVCQKFIENACGKQGKFRFNQDSIKKEYLTQNSAFEASIQKAAKDSMAAHPECFNAGACASADKTKLGSMDIEELKGKISELVGKGSVGDAGSRLEIDSSKTTSVNGDLTVFLK